MLSISAHLTWLVTHLRSAIGVYVAAQARPPQVVWLGDRAYLPRTAPERLPRLPEASWALLWNRLGRLAARFQALYDRWRSSTLPRPRKRAPRPTAAPTGPMQATPRLPRARGWVVHRIAESGPSAGQLEAMLANPETRDFLAAAPQVGRLLRPLCHALGVAQPGWLQRPARPRRPRPRPAPPSPAATPPDQPTRPLPAYVRAAARAWKKFDR